MDRLWLIVALCLVAGCMDPEWGGYFIKTRSDHPISVKIVNAPNPDLEARLKSLESRVTTLEEWAVKRGKRY